MQKQAPRVLADPPFERLPEVEYEGHPLYAVGVGTVGLLDRLRGYTRYIGIIFYLLWVRARQAMERRSLSRPTAAPHLEDLQRDGFVQLSFSDEDRAAILDAAAPYFDRLERHRATLGKGRTGYADGQIDTTADSAPELVSAVESALERSGILPTVRRYLDCQAEIRKVTVQMNDDGETYWRGHFEEAGLTLPDTAFFHVDNTYGVVKVIMYVSDVTETTGPFSYVPGTNRLRIGRLEGFFLRVTDIWVDVWPEHRGWLLTLPRALRKKAKFGDDIPDGSPWSRRLIEGEHFMTSEGGDLLLFDVMGIHRGGMIQSGERRILQIMMR